MLGLAAFCLHTAQSIGFPDGYQSAIDPYRRIVLYLITAMCGIAAVLLCVLHHAKGHDVRRAPRMHIVASAWLWLSVLGLVVHAHLAMLSGRGG
jgi:hypothetical protein